MPQVTAKRSFPAPRKEAFEYLTEPRNWPGFYSNLTDVDEGSSWSAAGDKVVFDYSILGRRVKAEATLEEYVYGELVRHSVRVPGLPDVHQEWVYSDTDDGFAVEVTMNTAVAESFLGRAIDRLLIPKALSRDLERTLENIEDMLSLGIPTA